MPVNQKQACFVNNFEWAAAILSPSCLLQLQQSVLEALLQLALKNPSARRAHFKYVNEGLAPMPMAHVTFSTMSFLAKANA